MRRSLPFVLGAALLLGTGCTDNTRARAFGGTATYDIEPGYKVISMSWKGENELWYHVRPMREGEQPETHEYREKSGMGVIEGRFILREHPRGATPVK